MVLENKLGARNRIIVKKDNRELKLEEIERMSAEDLKYCDIKILGKQLIIRENGPNVIYNIGEAKFSYKPGKKQSAQQVIDAAYSLAKILYRNINGTIL
ncbi:hypothetical protein J4449_02445 [Candidatus Woesearchaeota archaeon]|nr:hypothetical protein [Candidatus Woesearchaeota archaeon]